MAQGTCSIEGCGKSAKTRGWCKTHYSRWLRTGDAGAAVPVTTHRPPHAPDSRCAVDGCERHSKGGAKGWCHAHFERWRKNGDVLADIPLAARASRSADAVCAIDGCGKPRAGREWCAMHYERWRTHGDPLYVRAKQKVSAVASTGACAVDDCDRSATGGRGYCRRHYEKVRRYGDPHAERVKLPNSEVNYFRMHARLREARGSATTYRCVDCGRQAEQWAWVHDEDPCDFDNYVPMCRPCHKRYDAKPDTGDRLAWWWRRWHEAREAYRG